MAPLTFVSPFIGRYTSGDYATRLPSRCKRSQKRTSYPFRPVFAHLQGADAAQARQKTKSERIIGIVGKAKTSKQTSVGVDANAQKGLFGVKAKAYWDSMGVLPLFFAGFGVVALGIKMIKVKGGEWSSGPNGVNKVTVPKSAITSEAEEAELHVFKCGGCGYEMYPARGRESVFFPDSFKCPLCKTPKSEFWDLNDPTDPRNQVSEDEDEDEDDDEENDDEETPAEFTGNGSTTPAPGDQQVESTGTETPAKDLTDPDSSS